MSPLVPAQQEEEQQPKSVPDGHGRFYDSWPWQKLKLLLAKGLTMKWDELAIEWSDINGPNPSN